MALKRSQPDESISRIVDMESIAEQPAGAIQSTTIGTLNMLEACPDE